jgi:hypothetical protein
MKTNPDPPLSAASHVADDSRKDADALRLIIFASLWAIPAVITGITLLLIEMPLFWRVLCGVTCAFFAVLTAAGIFKLCGMMDTGQRPISLNPFHSGESKDDGGKTDGHQK